MARRKQNPAESAKRALILETAQKLFTSQAYSDVSMDALAEAVPVSKRTLYNHFKDKSALFTAVMQRRCQSISGVLEQILLNEKQSPEAALDKLAHHFLSVVLQPQSVNLYRTAIMQVQNFPGLGRLFYASGPMRCMEILAGYLKKLDRQGGYRIPDPTYAAGLFFSMLVGRMQMRLLLKVDKSVGRKEVEAHIDYVVGLFLRGHKR